MKGGDQQQPSNAFAQTRLMLLLVVLMAALKVGAQTSTTDSGQFGQITQTVSQPTPIYGSDLGADASPRVIELQVKFVFQPARERGRRLPGAPPYPRDVKAPIKSFRF